MISGARQHRGLVLIIVLWIITLLTIIAGSLVYTVRTETLLASHGVERAQAHALAQAGLNYAALQVLRPASERRWPVDGSRQTWRFGPGRVAITVTDVSGRVDLNSADRKLLRSLLVAVGVAEEDLDGLLDAIEDWRDADDLRRVNGAEREEYEAAGRAIGPKNKPFDSIEELQQVLGISATMYRQLAERVTVFSRQPGINPALATGDLLRMLPDVDEATIADYLVARAEHFAQGLPPPAVPINSPFFSTAQGLAYHIAVSAHLTTGVIGFIEATITQPRRAGEAFHVLAWREGR